MGRGGTHYEFAHDSLMHLFITPFTMSYRLAFLRYRMAHRVAIVFFESGKTEGKVRLMFL
jgi:hypothetical protein